MKKVKEPKETIKEQDNEKKFIVLCAWCEDPNYTGEKPFSKKWDKKGYTISHGMCKDCAKDY